MLKGFILRRPWTLVFALRRWLCGYHAGVADSRQRRREAVADGALDGVALARSDDRPRDADASRTRSRQPMRTIWPASNFTLRNCSACHGVPGAAADRRSRLGSTSTRHSSPSTASKTILMARPFGKSSTAFG